MFFLIKKKLKNKSSNLIQLWFSGKLFIRVCLTRITSWHIDRYKTAGKIHSTWFFNNTVNLKLTDNGPIHKISHIVDIENIFEINNFEEYLNNSF